MIDDTISWKYHIPYIIYSRVSRGIGIFSKLRHYLSITQLKQLYYNIIYPHISYAITAWGSTYKSDLYKKVTNKAKPSYEDYVLCYNTWTSHQECSSIFKYVGNSQC